MDEKKTAIFHFPGERKKKNKKEKQEKRKILFLDKHANSNKIGTVKSARFYISKSKKNRSQSISVEYIENPKVVNAIDSLTSDQFINFELNDFAQFLNNELQIKLSVKLKLGKHYGPTIVQLIQEGYKEFVKGFYKKNIKYSAILSEINLSLKRIRRKDIEVKRLAEELKYITQHLKEVLDLAPGEAPSLNQLVILGYRGFVVYLEKNNIDFNDVAIEAGLSYRNLQQSFLTYDDFLRLAMDKSYTFPLDREQFEERMKNRGRNISPSHVIFPWQCKKHGTWNTTYQTLKNAKYGCPNCYRESTRITYGDCVELAKTKDYEFAMDVYQFNKRIKDETIKANEEGRDSIRQSDLTLLWRCKSHGEWETSYNIFRNTKIGCPKCALDIWQEKVSLNFKDFLEVCKYRDDLEFGLDLNQFNEVMKLRTNSPSSEPVSWRCLKNPSHGVWKAPFSRIALDHGCPFCQERTRVISVLIHVIIEYHTIIFLKSKNCNAKYEKTVNEEFGFTPDVLLIRDINFINNIEKMQIMIKFPDLISEISIDFTYSTDTRAIIEKCFKEYQSENRILIVVLLREVGDLFKNNLRKTIASNENIKNSNFIKIFDINDFLSFLMPKWFESPEDRGIKARILQVRNLGLEAINAEPSLQDIKFQNVKRESEKFQDQLKKLFN